MWLWVVVCLYMLALRRTGDLSRVYPADHNPVKDKRYRKWLTDLVQKKTIFSTDLVQSIQDIYFYLLTCSNKAPNLLRYIYTSNNFNWCWTTKKKGTLGQSNAVLQ